MQCPSCGFQNMPGSEDCPRCGSSLRLATMVMDVNPPRARGGRGRIRRLSWLGRRSVRAARRIAEANAGANDAGAERIEKAGSAAPILWRLIVPGWSQIYLGQYWQGALFFVGFAGPLAAGLLYWGTTAGEFWLATAFVGHQAALLDVIHQCSFSDGIVARICRSLIGMFVVAGAIWLPAAVALFQFADPITLQQTIGPLEQGDVVLVNHRAPALRGSMILFDQPHRYLTAGYRTGRPDPPVYELGGMNIDRILAVAGDSVEVSGRQLFVNGVVSRWMPLSSRNFPVQAPFTVPPQTVLVVPSATGNAVASRLWQADFCTPVDAISGTIYFRWGPPSRIGPIH